MKCHAMLLLLHFRGYISQASVEGYNSYDAYALILVSASEWHFQAYM